MKTTDSQLDYLGKRGKSYDRKYGIIEAITSLLISQDLYVIELFGGVGITSYYIKKNMDPKFHVINEIDDKCLDVLRRLQADPDKCLIAKEDSFFTDLTGYDVVFADSNFTKKLFPKFDHVFRNVKDTLVLTETGIFNLKFNKTITPLEYFRDYKQTFLKKYNLYLSEAFYTSSFSIMILQKEKCGLTVFDSQDINKEWREYIKNV